MTKADLNLAAKIIREAIAYAGELGFKPHRDYRSAMLMLDDADPEACDESIPLGKDGKPFFVAGPYDNVDRIMSKLTRKLGPDGFTYVVPIGGDQEVFSLDEDEQNTVRRKHDHTSKCRRRPIGRTDACDQQFVASRCRHLS
jgi:hypothetical protein